MRFQLVVLELHTNDVPYSHYLRTLTFRTLLTPVELLIASFLTSTSIIYFLVFINQLHEIQLRVRMIGNENVFSMRNGAFIYHHGTGEAKICAE